jgi:hypothetical protein
VRNLDHESAHPPYCISFFSATANSLKFERQSIINVVIKSIAFHNNAHYVPS